MAADAHGLSSSSLFFYFAAVAMTTAVATMAATMVAVAANSWFFGFITRINKKGAATTQSLLSVIL